MDEELQGGQEADDVDSDDEDEDDDNKADRTDAAVEEVTIRQSTLSITVYFTLLFPGFLTCSPAQKEVEQTPSTSSCIFAR